MYLFPTVFRSMDTIELKSVALGIATDGFDDDLLFLLQTWHVSRTFSMCFLVSVSSFPAFLNAYSIWSLLLWLSFLWISSTAFKDLISFSFTTNFLDMSF